MVINFKIKGSVWAYKMGERVYGDKTKKIMIEYDECLYGFYL